MWKEASVKPILNSDQPVLWTLTAVCCLALVLWLPTQSRSDSDPPVAPSAADVEKIHITADRLISDTANNQAEFIGNVTVSQGETRITADSLTVFFLRRPDSTETSPTQSLQKLVATGNVEIKFDNRLAVAKEAVYITAERILTLTGPNAAVTSGDNTISGESITFYRADGRFTVKGGSSGPVKAVILPEGSGLE
jgi:lipopolysaccharide export system protein LptA